jgi:hypothetical protein
MRPIPFELFKIVSPHRTQVSLIDSGADRLNSFPERSNQIPPKTAIKFNVGFKPIKIGVSKLDFHSKAVSADRVMNVTSQVQKRVSI